MRGLLAAAVLAVGGAGTSAFASCPDSITLTLQPQDRQFTMTYVPDSYAVIGGNTHICYDLETIGHSEQLSHFVIGLCVGQSVVSVEYNGDPFSDYSVGQDGSTGAYGLKIGSDNEPPNGRYCIVVQGAWELGCTTVTMKKQNHQSGEIKGISCNPIVVPPQFCIGGEKFYDANANGQRDPGELGIPNFRIAWSYTTPDNVVVSGTAVTDVDGIWRVCDIPEGSSYSAYEMLPLGTWIQTMPLDPVTQQPTGYEGIVNADVLNLDFGNLCLGGGGGHTMGFWSNPNGRQLFNAQGGLALVNALNKVNTAGNFVGPFANHSQFRSWLLGASATNMAYMLSAQNAAMNLNVHVGFVDGNSLVYIGGGYGNTGVGNNYISINDLMLAANASVGSDPLTLEGHPARDYQEALKNALDAANNNQNFVQPVACPVNYGD